MSKDDDDLRQLLRASRRLRNNPGASAAFDQLDKAITDQGLGAAAYLEGVRDIVRQFDH